MDRVEFGFGVFGVDDRRLGRVSRLNPCCFEVTTADRSIIPLVPRAIFNVDGRRVTLLCSIEEVTRYICPRHTSAPNSTVPPE